MHPISPLAGILSYLVPGLGQIYQGRIGKGVLFLACIYTLFFYGNALGSGSVKVMDHGSEVIYRVGGAVYLPDVYEPRPLPQGMDPGEGGPPVEAPRRNPLSLDRLATNLYNRPQFVGQFWVGIAAWPAIYQYYKYGRDYTTPDPRIGFYMREPSERAVNAVGTAGSKTMDLGWVFTVIAGVLNIMVIYDALAGPAVIRAVLHPVERKEPAEATPEAIPENVAPLMPQEPVRPDALQQQDNYPPRDA